MLFPWHAGLTSPTVCIPRTGKPADGEPNDALLAGFADAGWTHGGFHTGYDVVCQWMYVKDLTGITNGKGTAGVIRQTCSVECQAGAVDGCARS